MDKNDFKLTDEQKQLVKQFVDAYRKMKAAGVYSILCQEKEDSYVTFINCNGAVDFGDEDKTECYEEERIDITDIVCDSTPYWVSFDDVFNMWAYDKFYAVPDGVDFW